MGFFHVTNFAAAVGMIRDFCGPPADLEESLPALLQILAHDHPRVRFRKEVGF
jgi:hypothetical protein